MSALRRLVLDMFRRFAFSLFVTVTVIVPSVSYAGYGWGGYCWDKLETAIGVYALMYNSAATGASILMYSPSVQRAYLLKGSDVIAVDGVYGNCTSQGLGDYGATPNNWYSPPAGVLIAGSSSGNVETPSSGGSLTANIAGWTMTNQDGLKLGIAIAGIFTVAAVFRVLAGVGSSRSSDDD